MSKQFKVAVFGDGMTDKYWLASAERISPEAPIPVCKVKEKITFPGGAGNVDRNLQMLGVSTWCFYHDWPVKNRLMVDGVQIARWDEDDFCAAPKKIKFHGDEDAIVVADYAKGGVDERVVEAIKQTRLPIFVDTKRDPSVWSGIATAVFPNSKEYAQFNSEYYKLGNAYDTLICWKAGAKGLYLYQDTHIIASSPSQARFVRSVNGAGDTVIAAFVYAYLDQVKHHEAVSNKPENMIAWRSVLDFANAAAAISVEHDYTYAPTLEEVNERYYDQRSH